MMKKNLLFLFVLLLTFQAQAQEVPEVQKSMVTKVTASWCLNCGTWGWNLFEEVLEDNAEKALIIANHSSGDLDTPTTNEIVSNFGVSSQPRFVLDNTDQNVSSGNTSTKRTAIKDQIDANFSSSPVVNAGLDVVLDGNELMVNTKTKFFQSTMGEYYVGVYIIENDVVNSQQGQGAEAMHKNVMRTAMGAGTFGELVMNGNINMGMEFNHQFSMMLNTAWNVDNLEIATIVWKKEDETYQFVNTHSTTTFGEPTQVTEISNDILTMAVQPTVSRGNSDLIIDIKQQQGDFQIQVFNQLGQLQKTVFDGQLNTGLHQFPLNGNFSAGIYYVRIQNNEGILTKEFIVK